MLRDIQPNYVLYIYTHMHIHSDQSSHDLGLSKKEEHHQMASLINGANDDKSDKVI